MNNFSYFVKRFSENNYFVEQFLIIEIRNKHTKNTYCIWKMHREHVIVITQCPVSNNSFGSI